MPYAPDLSGCALDGRYELHDLIGEGTFGRVYRGRDRRLARQVAIKVIKPWWSDDPEWVLSFEREAQLMARVSDPGIVQIFDVGQASEGLYYVAELVDGESLASRLRREPLSWLEACEIAAELCRALGHAHAQNVVHRDVKPENVLISSRGRVKVGDFGIARLADGSTGDGGATVIGTPRYMAPEQAQGGPTSPATDVYSAGVVLYEMLAGRPPFSGEAAVEVAVAHLQSTPAPLPASVPDAVAQVVERALAKRPADRYPTAAAMADALTDACVPPSRPAPARRAGANGAPPTAAPPTAAPPTAAPPTAAPPTATRVAPKLHPRRDVNPAGRRRSVAAIAIALLVLLALIGGSLVLGADDQVRIPDLHGLSRGRAAAAAARLKLGISFVSRFDQAPSGTVLTQSPRAGVTVKTGTVLHATFSAGPAPVKVPPVTGQTTAFAEALFKALGLRVRAVAVPAPTTTPGTVVRQQPVAGAFAAAHSTVTLYFAETPRWRDLTSLAGSGSGVSVPFKIRGARWRLVYSLQYQGTCTFVFFCSGPTAKIIPLGGGQQSSSFGLSEGSGRTRTIDSGPGLYEVRVTPGSDTARWVIQIQDDY